MYQVEFIDSWGITSTIVSEWRNTISENQNYLEPNSKVRVRDRDGRIIYRFRVTESGKLDAG